MAVDSVTKPASEPAPSIFQRVEAILERCSEFLNPLLVKEARQALKSNQFASTFILLMTLGWGWSFLGVSISDNSLAIGPDGRGMLYGYFVILVVALFVVVPFSAFRSLAAEREDGTFELISITTLSARQIVFGKLGSAVVQMAVYLSALAPCIAFTSLLRGVDIFLISFLLGITCSASLAFSSFGLVFATVTRARHWQAALSVMLVLGLGLATLIWLVSSYEMFVGFGNVSLDNEVFWTSVLNVASAALSFVALFTMAAASQLSFASDNRATNLRIVMVAQNILCIGWFLYYWLEGQDWDYFLGLIACAGVYWGMAGALMTAESPQLSPRVLRDLPQSLAGRAFFSWFNPGSGTGYVFALANMGVVVLVTLGAIGLTQVLGVRQFGFPAAPPSLDLGLCGILAWSYIAIYLGIGRVLLLIIRQFIYVSLPLAFVVYVALHVVGNMVPFMIFATIDRYSSSYMSILAPSWMMTMAAAFDGKLGAEPAVPFIIILGLVSFAVNLFLAAFEVGYERQAVPLRVQADELELHPERLPKKEKSPWDE